MSSAEKRREVCNALLEEIECSMRSVIVSTTDYDTLELIHTARRLYQSKKGKMGTLEKQEISRRFAEGYRRLLLMTDGKPPPEWADLQDRLMAYRRCVFFFFGASFRGCICPVLTFVRTTGLKYSENFEIWG